MKFRSTQVVFIVAAILPVSAPIWAEDAKPIKLEVVAQVDLGQAVGQLRAVPVCLGTGQPKAILAIHGQDAEIDPYVGMFFFPKSTLRMCLFDETGKVMWRRDLGPGVVPGIWFTPVYSFDLDSDGVDEIWFVGNSDPAHPLDYRRYVLERIDPRTGQSTGTWPWPHKNQANSMSARHRNFVLGGFVRGKPRLVTAQGTYGQMALQGWDQDMSIHWETLLDPAEDGGTLGSHVCPVADINRDGVDDVLWGERCIELAGGRQLFCAGQERWKGHSDIVQPVLDRSSGRWFIHTCRETSQDQGPRIVAFDDQGKQVWGAVDSGHIDTGWAARIGPHGTPVVLGVKVGEKIRDAQGERRLWTESYLFNALTGEKHELPFDPYTTIPVDLNGDGIHELVKGYFEGDGTVYDHSGKVLGNVGGLTAMCSQFTRRPGEQMLSFTKDGTVRIWADMNAHDTAAAKARYESKYYYVNQRMTACGYNLFSLGGI